MSAIPPDDLAAYADLVLRVGLAFQPGQVLAINARIEQAAAARALAEAAYAAGASYCDVWYFDPHVKRSRIEHAPEATLATPPGWLDRRYADLTEAGGCLVKLAGEPSPHLFDGLPDARVALDPMPNTPAGFRAQASMAIRWNIVPFPSEGWAERVYGEPDVARLWAELRAFLRLDTPDPIAAWNEHLARLDARAAGLARLDLRALHFVGPGADLRLALIPGTRWDISTHTDPGGTRNVLNLPTEEVYTTPRRDATEGTVRARRPLVLGGSLIEGLELTFANGAVVDVRAERGADAVRTAMAVDEGARRLGEVALVDRASPITRSATPTFFETTLDENASCHLAWGFGIPTVFPDFRTVSVQELAARGMNVSATHTDFMVGGPGLRVIGIDAAGAEHTILDDETWRLALPSAGGE